MLSQKETVSSSTYRLLLNLFSPPPPPPLPTVTITSFEFMGTLGGVSATPTVQFSNTDATSMTVTLYQSASTVDNSFSVLNTQTPTPTGFNSVNFTNTIANRWYYYTVIVTNVTGSASASSTHIQNSAAPPPSLTFTLSGTQFFYPDTGQAYPYTIASISPDQGSSAQINWDCYEYNGYGYPNDILIDSATVSGPFGAIQYVYSGAFTRTDKQFYYWVQISGGPGGTVSELSALSPTNFGPS